MIHWYRFSRKRKFSTDLLFSNRSTSFHFYRYELIPVVSGYRGDYIDANPEELSMDEFPKPRRTLAEFRLLRRRSVQETINASPLTIFINLLIELFAAAVMIVGLSYLVRFMFLFRDRFDQTYYKYMLIFIMFFAVAWGTHILFRLIKQYRDYREAVGPKQDPAKKPEREE